MSNSIKDVRLDTRYTTFFPIINLYNGKFIRMQYGKPNEWKTVDELIDFYQIGQTLFINDLNPPYHKANRSTLDRLFKQFNCWYSAAFSSPKEANQLVEKGVERIVYKLDAITKEVINSVDNDKLVMSFSLAKNRNTENDEKLFDQLKTNGKHIKYLILNLNQDFNSKEVVETTTQIYDLFRKEDYLEDVKMGVNARNIITRSELQLLISSGVDPHIGYPIHNNLLKLGEVYSLLLNDLLQSNHLNLPKNSLPHYPTTVQDIDGHVYETYYSTKNTLEKTVNKRYGVYWSRELHREFKMKKQKIKTIYFSKDKTSLLFIVDTSDSALSFDKYKNPVRRRLDWLTPTDELTMTMGEQIKADLFESINTNFWSDSVQHLINLFSINNTAVSTVLDKVMEAPKMLYSLEEYKRGYSFYSKIDFSLANPTEPINIVTNSEYYAKRWLETTGLKYCLMPVNISDEELMSRFDDGLSHALFIATQDEYSSEKFYQLDINVPLYYQFDNSRIVVEESDDRVVKKVGEEYLALFKRNSYQQYLLLKQVSLSSEYPFIRSTEPPSEVKVKVNSKKQVLFQREGVTISDDEAAEYFDDLSAVKLFLYKLYETVGVENGFIVDLGLVDMNINYIQAII